MFAFFRAIKRAYKEEKTRKVIMNEQKVEEALAEHFAKSLATAQANIEYEIQDRAKKLAKTEIVKKKAQEELEKHRVEGSWSKPKTN